MLLLGLLLCGASAAFAGLLIVENWGGGPEYTVMMFGHHLGHVTTLEAFLAGIALTLVFLLSALLTAAGARRSSRRRRELRALRSRIRRSGTTTAKPVPATSDPVKGDPVKGDPAPATTVSMAKPRRKLLNPLGR